MQQKIYTGYFAKLKKYEEVGLIPVSIAGKAPAFYAGRQYKVFAPTWEIFSQWKSGCIDNFEYTELFKRNVLDKLDKNVVLHNLLDIGESIVLLCYEKSGDFCHRHIVADWLESELNLRVDEYLV